MFSRLACIWSLTVKNIKIIDFHIVEKVSSKNKQHLYTFLAEFSTAVWTVWDHRLTDNEAQRTYTETTYRWLGMVEGGEVGYLWISDAVTLPWY